MKRYTSLFIGLAILGFGFVIGGLTQMSSTTHSGGETVAALLVGGFFILLDVMMWLALPATLSLNGTLLTLRKRKVFPSSKSIDLKDVVRLEVLPGRNKSPTIVLYGQAGHRLWLDLAGYPMKDKLALLPTLQEVCNRPGIQKNQDEVVKALNNWYNQ